MIHPQRHIAAMAPYAVADLSTPGTKTLTLLAQNESLRPPSPQAQAAAAQALTSGALYPDPEWTVLRHAISAAHAVPAEHILCGNGSLDLIGCLARVYAGPDRSVLIPAHAYPFFRSAGQMVGARVDTAPERAFSVDVDALLERVTPDTGIVFVANPGNPTGTRIAKSELERLRAGLREDILLVIDEAYGEFADTLNEPTFDLVAGGHTCVLRTFSKAYGIAGFRVGWCLFPDAISPQMR